MVLPAGVFSMMVFIMQLPCCRCALGRLLTQLGVLDSATAVLEYMHTVWQLMHAGPNLPSSFSNDLR